MAKTITKCWNCDTDTTKEQFCSQTCVCTYFTCDCLECKCGYCVKENK